MSALSVFNITEQNRATVSKSLLLNMARITDYYEDSVDGVTVFYYEGLIRRRGNTTEYKSDLSMDQFRAKIALEVPVDFGVNPWLHMYVLTVNDVVRNEDYEVQSAKIIQAQDVDNDDYDNYCEMYIQHGGFEMVKFGLPFSIAELDATQSISGSMSRVGLPTYSDGAVYSVSGAHGN